MNSIMNPAVGAGVSIEGICSSLSADGYSVRFWGFSAIDKYLGLPALPFLWVQTNADIGVLARCIENLRFPGAEIADGAVDIPAGTCYFRCLDSDEVEGKDRGFPLLSFYSDWQTLRFQDPLDLYPLLRELRNNKLNFEELSDLVCYNITDRYRLIMEVSLILARYDFETAIARYICAFAQAPESGFPGLLPGPEAQRAFLSCLMVSPRPDRGLEFLKRSGVLYELWPELASLDEVDHSKEFHPEGNVWNHTLETFQHRKAAGDGAYDLRLSLGLLLHDTGKPISAAHGSRRFDGHAELGARAAARFLERLEFDPTFINNIFYLVKNHMLPAALKRLPLTKTAEIMASPLFPTLMELYRCDESSSFKGLGGYYENSAAYQTYLRNMRNPYRSADGKKITRQIPLCR